MNYHEFTDELVRTLTADPRVLGIVALGSMAARGRQPDRYSDHDFFVISAAAVVELRASTEWLPRREQLALWFRETPHGCKGVYDDGHLIEYAVFTPDELSIARANDYRVLLDRERIEERMAAIAFPPGSHDLAWLHGMFLSNLLVASQRAQRGELASARWMLAHAMRHLVTLLGGGDDSLDPLRRFDHYALEQAMRLGPASATRAMLDVYERECNGDPRAIAAVRIAQ